MGGRNKSGHDNQLRGALKQLADPANLRHTIPHQMMLYSCRCLETPAMRTTLALDDDLVAQAQAFTGLKERSSLVREALKALIERESARRLAALGGSEPGLTAPPRRRPAAR
jgi:Arc/MetJ family transcription regulator